MKVVLVELAERGAGGLTGMEVPLVTTMGAPGLTPVPIGTGTEAMDGGVVATTGGAG